MKNQAEILKEQKALKQALKKQYHVEKLGIFGSYASESATQESDLDLLVEFEDELPNIYEIKKELKAFLEQKFDIKSTWQELYSRRCTPIKKTKPCGSRMAK